MNDVWWTQGGHRRGRVLPNDRFVCNSASVYYCERKKKNKNGEGLGTRLLLKLHSCIVKAATCSFTVISHLVISYWSCDVSTHVTKYCARIWTALCGVVEYSLYTQYIFFCKVGLACEIGTLPIITTIVHVALLEAQHFHSCDLMCTYYYSSMWYSTAHSGSPQDALHLHYFWY